MRNYKKELDRMHEMMPFANGESRPLNPPCTTLGCNTERLPDGRFCRQCQDVIDEQTSAVYIDEKTSIVYVEAYKADRPPAWFDGIGYIVAGLVGVGIVALIVRNIGQLKGWWD